MARSTDPEPGGKSIGGRLPRSGKLQVPGDGSDYISLIHVADLAEAFVLAAERAPFGAVMSVVDDQPTTYRELFGYIADLEDVPAPTAGGASNFPSFRISNAKARKILGWRPCYRSYRSGLA